MTESSAISVAPTLARRKYGVFDDFSEGVQVVDFNYRYLYLNRVVVEQSHQSLDELLGAVMMEAYPGIEDTKMFGALRECMDSRKATQTTNDFTFPDGEKLYFQLRTGLCTGVRLISTATLRPSLERAKSSRFAPILRRASWVL